MNTILGGDDNSLSLSSLSIKPDDIVVATGLAIEHEEFIEMMIKESVDEENDFNEQKNLNISQFKDVYHNKE